jgi:hypothetical protein
MTQQHEIQGGLRAGGIWAGGSGPNKKISTVLCSFLPQDLCSTVWQAQRVSLEAEYTYVWGVWQTALQPCAQPTTICNVKRGPFPARTWAAAGVLCSHLKTLLAQSGHC